MRLIDADALFISKEYCVDEAGFGASFYVVHKSDIDEAPTVDAELVKHGRWIDHTTEGENMAREIVEILISCNCSECGFDGRHHANYCHNCGAKMDLEGKE